MKKIVIISGPTAVGKTSISIKMAHRLNGEIISADSMQVYKGMDIGSAKITSGEMEGIRHHLIDILAVITCIGIFTSFVAFPAMLTGTKL